MAVIRKIRCKVDRIIDHGSRVYTLELIPEKSIPAFRPGQFLHLALDGYDPSGFWPDSRAFSIASSPTEREKVQITYSVKGQFTGRMERELNEGQYVWVKLPFGDFMVDETGDVVLFAGGTGITAYTAFLQGLTSAYPHSVTLAYGARTKNLLVYRNLISEKALLVSNLHVFFYEEEEHSVSSDEIHGRISVSSLLPQIRNLLCATYFVSGPPLMLKNITSDLRLHGVPAESIKIDAWE